MPQCGLHDWDPEVGVAIEDWAQGMADKGRQTWGTPGGLWVTINGRRVNRVHLVRDAADLNAELAVQRGGRPVAGFDCARRCPPCILRQMTAADETSAPSVQERVDDLAATVAQDHGDIAKLQYRADEASQRADLSDQREDVQDERLTNLETHVDVDREMIVELQEEGLLSTEHAAELELALRTSRKIGAAIGIVMAYLQVNEEEAFAFLSKASQDSNRKLRDLAEVIVINGHAGGLSLDK